MKSLKDSQLKYEDLYKFINTLNLQLDIQFNCETGYPLHTRLHSKLNTQLVFQLDELVNFKLWEQGR